MPNPIVMNPDSTVLQQLDGHWQKLAALILWKLAGRQMVTVSHADMERFSKEFAPEYAVIFTHGRHDAIDFQIVTVADAERIAAHDKSQRGMA